MAQLEAGRPEGVRTLEQFIAQSPGSELTPTARVLVAEAQAKAGRTREALEHYQALVRARADPRPRAAGALPDRRAVAPAEPPGGRRGGLDARSGGTSRRTRWPGRRGSPRPGSMSKRKQWDRALQVAQSVANRSGAERSDALLVVGQSALQLRRNPEAAQAYHAVVVESPPASKRYFEGLAGLAASLEAATDRDGARRAYREIVDTSQDPELVQWAKRRLAGARRATASAAPKAPTPTKSKAKP